MIDMGRRRRSMVAVRRIGARLGGGVTGRSWACGERVAALLALLTAALLPVPARAHQATPEPGPPPGDAAGPPAPVAPTAGAASAPGTAANEAVPEAPSPEPPAPAPPPPDLTPPVPPAESPPAAPEEPPPAIIPWLSLPPRLPPTQIHAFVSQGYIRSTKNNYLLQDSTRGSF